MDEILVLVNRLGDAVAAARKKRLAAEKEKIDKVTESSLQITEKTDESRQEIENPTLNEIISQLRIGICSLFFFKKTTGGMRRMTCTLNGHSPSGNAANRPGVVVVWDLEARNWRSFYPESVYKLIRNEQTDIQ